MKITKSIRFFNQNENKGTPNFKFRLWNKKNKNNKNKNTTHEKQESKEILL